MAARRANIRDRGRGSGPGSIAKSNSSPLVGQENCKVADIAVDGRDSLRESFQFAERIATITPTLQFACVVGSA